MVLWKWTMALEIYSPHSWSPSQVCELPKARAAAISIHDMILTASGRHHTRLHSEAGMIKVVGNWHPDCGRQVWDQNPRRDGHLGVVGDRASCAVRRRKHLPYRSGRIECMVFELFEHKWSASSCLIFIRVWNDVNWARTSVLRFVVCNTNDGTRQQKSSFRR